MAETAEPKTIPDAEKKKEQSLPFYQLLSFADKYDWLLMISGSLGAVVHGSSMPVFFLFGEMVNGFGKNQSDLKKMTAEVSKFALYFVYLGLVVCVSSYSEIACWMYTGERQVSTLRKKYLDAVLKQDVGFFDTDARTGDIVFSVSTDTLLVQDAISEKVLLARQWHFNYTTPDWSRQEMLRMKIPIPTEHWPFVSKLDGKNVWISGPHTPKAPRRGPMPPRLNLAEMRQIVAVLFQE